MRHLVLQRMAHLPDNWGFSSFLILLIVADYNKANFTAQAGGTKESMEQPIWSLPNTVGGAKSTSHPNT
jgi:hypothetical protein